jgi:hypothetical protein
MNATGKSPSRSTAHNARIQAGFFVCADPPVQRLNKPQAFEI